MAEGDLIHSDVAHRISASPIVTNYRPFIANPGLIRSPYSS
jgi:hypothetical protein